MTFLQPFILWGLPLLFIPVIIHLLNRLRHRPQPWAAMRFLRSANQRSISQAKLRQFLILLFRVLAVVALVFFLSRPMAGGWLGWMLSPAPEVIVLALDRSASMEAQAGDSGKSRRQQAIDLWADALAPFQQSRLVLLDSAAQIPQELPNLAALRQESFTGPTDSAADIAGLLLRAFTYLSDTRPGAAEIWIASDLQESNWLPNDAQWARVMAQFAALPQKVRFRLLTFEESPQNNISISLAEAVRRSRGGERSLDVAVDVQQTGEASGPLVLKWNLGRGASQREVNLSGQSLRWRNRFPLPSANEGGWGSIEIGADANAADNKLFFAFDAERAPTALIVTASGPNTARPLQLAASDLSKGPSDWAKLVSPQEFAGVALTNTALIVWHSSDMPGAAPGLLEDFASSGGSLVFLPEKPEGSAWTFAGSGFGPSVLAKTNELFTVAQWNELEGPFSKTDEGFAVPVGSLEVYQRAAISGSGAALASFAEGAPFLTRAAIGKGEAYFCATSPDPAWSALADGAVLVPMLQRLLAAGARRVNTASMIDCGEARAAEGWSRADEASPSDPRLRAGVYQTEGRFVAVNRPAAENDLARISSEAARQLFASVPFRLHEEKSSGADRLQGEIWRIFVSLMLAFLLLESFLLLPPSAGSIQARVPVRKPAEVPA